MRSKKINDILNKCLEQLALISQDARGIKSVKFLIEGAVKFSHDGLLCEKEIKRLSIASIEKMAKMVGCFMTVLEDLKVTEDESVKFNRLFADLEETMLAMKSFVDNKYEEN